MFKRRRLLAVAGLGALARPARAQGPNLRIARIQGVNFLPLYVMERRRLVEKQAAALGVAGLAVEWVNFAGGGGATDAMLSGSVDVVSAGPGNMLLLWDRTRGAVRGIVSNAALPARLITRDPRIKTLSDYAENDRIAVPTVGVSTQAILLQIAAAAQFGAPDWRRLDPNTVQMGHADAFVAMMNPRHEVASHFASPPFITRELREVPGARVVTDSTAIIGANLSTAVLFATNRFTDANPALVRAVIAASEEAVALIRDDPAGAAADYLAISGDRMAAQDLTALLREPGMVFSTRPEGTLTFAQFLHRIGTLRMQPAAWTDYFVPAAAGLGGS